MKVYHDELNELNAQQELVCNGKPVYHSTTSRTLNHFAHLSKKVKPVERDNGRPCVTSFDSRVKTRRCNSTSSEKISQLITEKPVAGDRLPLSSV